METSYLVNGLSRLSDAAAGPCGIDATELLNPIDEKKVGEPIFDFLAFAAEDEKVLEVGSSATVGTGPMTGPPPFCCEATTTVASPGAKVQDDSSPAPSFYCARCRKRCNCLHIKKLLQMRAAPEPVKLSCPHCAQKYSHARKKSFEHHVRSHQMNGLKCRDCGEVLRTTSCLINHAVEIHGWRPSKLRQFGSWFGKSRPMIAPEKFKLRNEVELRVLIPRISIETCKTCKKGFVDPRAFAEHQKSVCKAPTATKLAVSGPDGNGRRLQYPCVQLNPSGFECVVCHRTFPSIEGWAVHARYVYGHGTTTELRPCDGRSTGLVGNENAQRVNNAELRQCGAKNEGTVVATSNPTIDHDHDHDCLLVQSSGDADDAANDKLNPTHCIVRHCNGNYGKIQPFPEDTNLQALWCAILGVTATKFQNHNGVCELHFCDVNRFYPTLKIPGRTTRMVHRLVIEAYKSSGTIHKLCNGCS